MKLYPDLWKQICRLVKRRFECSEKFIKHDMTTTTLVNNQPIASKDSFIFNVENIFQPQVVRRTRLKAYKYTTLKHYICDSESGKVQTYS